MLPLKVHGETGTAVYERLEAVNRATSLIYVDKPWHLKMEVTLYDKSGAASGEGTIERWQSGDDTRTVSTFGDSSRTVLEHGGKEYRIVKEQSIPEPADVLLRTVLHPGPYPADTAGTTPDLRPTEISKVKLDCIMLSRRMIRVAAAPLGLFPTYCLSEGDRLGVIFEFGGQIIVRDRLGKFLDHEVTTSASVTEGRTLLARAKVLQLGTFVPKPDEFAPSEAMVETAKDVKLSGGVIAGRKISGSNPIYPESERFARASGSVVLEAKIGTDGRIFSLIPVSAPDADFAISAIAAVRDWKYTPYLLNGVPTEVTTTITVNYNMR